MNPADIDHPTISNPETLARTTAKTALGDYHFGEKVTSLREMCKRYQPFGRFSATFPVSVPLINNIIGGNVPLVAAIPVLGENPTTTALTNHPGFIGTVAPMYRLFRGPLTFKLKVSNPSRDTPNFRGYVGFLPSPIQLATPNALQSLATSAITRINETNSTCPPLAYFSQDQVAEFMVPFVNHYSTAVVTNSFDIGTPLSLRSEYMGYQLVVFIYADGIASSSRYDMTLTYAFADETHFGTFIGVPPIRRLANVFPNLI